MKKRWVLLLFSLMVSSVLYAGTDSSKEACPSDQILKITAYDGVTFLGRLRLPAERPVKKLVIYVNGSGPSTYDDKRSLGDGTVFSYFDLFAEKCNDEGTGFFSYDTRGVSPSDQPPTFSTIDTKVYQTYRPTNEIQDIETIIRTLQAIPCLHSAKIILLGWSCGTMVAPEVALRKKVQVDALILAGYMNDTMDETITWQNSGIPSMMFYCRYFDADKDGTVSAKEFSDDPYKILPALGLDKNHDFEKLDTNKDGKLDADDFALMLIPYLAQLKEAIDTGNDEWIATHYGVRLTSGWFMDYRNHMPANREVLPRLDIPIYIFQGTEDRNVPMQGALDIKDTFKELGKTNLVVHVFPGHDHDLNYMTYPLGKGLSEGFQEIFRTIGKL
jgi:pimeloyl-ACP methyl ester carboxylesterase